MKSSKLLTGVLTGVALGALLGVLFAPKKGASIRKSISDQSNMYADELNEKFNEFINSISRRFDVVKKEAMRLAENSKSKVSEMELKDITKS